MGSSGWSITGVTCTWTVWCTTRVTMMVLPWRVTTSVTTIGVGSTGSLQATSPTTIIRKLNPSLPSKNESKKVGINIAFDRYERRFGKNIYLILDQIAMALKIIEELGYEIINICHLESDRKFEIALDNRKVRYQTANLQYMLPNKVYEFYNDIELMMGMRGHAQMIPFGLNTKIISLGTHPKLAYFLEDINALDWYIDVNESPNKLCKLIIGKFNTIMNFEKNEIEERLAMNQHNLFQITEKNLKMIMEISAQYESAKKSK